MNFSRSNKIEWFVRIFQESDLPTTLYYSTCGTTVQYNLQPLLHSSSGSRGGPQIGPRQRRNPKIQPGKRVLKKRGGEGRGGAAHK